MFPQCISWPACFLTEITRMAENFPNMLWLNALSVKVVNRVLKCFAMSELQVSCKAFDLQVRIAWFRFWKHCTFNFFPIAPTSPYGLRPYPGSLTVAQVQLPVPGPTLIMIYIMICNMIMAGSWSGLTLIMIYIIWSAEPALRGDPDRTIKRSVATSLLWCW